MAYQRRASLIPRRDGWVIDSKLGEGAFGECLASNNGHRKRGVFKFCFEPNGCVRSSANDVFRLHPSELARGPDFARLDDFQIEKPPIFLESEYVCRWQSGQLGRTPRRNWPPVRWPGRLSFSRAWPEPWRRRHSLASSQRPEAVESAVSTETANRVRCWGLRHRCSVRPHLAPTRTLRRRVYRW